MVCDCSASCLRHLGIRIQLKKGTEMTQETVLVAFIALIATSIICCHIPRLRPWLEENEPNWRADYIVAWVVLISIAAILVLR